MKPIVAWITAVCFVVGNCWLIPASAVAHEPPEGKPKPGPNRADEPMAKRLSLKLAGEFLDGATLAWHNAKQCASCHTTYP